jgi:hypothetical protein
MRKESHELATIQVQGKTQNSDEQVRTDDHSRRTRDKGRLPLVETKGHLLTSYPTDYNVKYIVKYM